MNKETESICIVGAGSWATALCKIFSDTGRPVNWWYHRPEDAAQFMQTGRNPRYLSDVDFSGKNITAFSNLKEAIGISGIILVVVPSAYAAQVLDQLPQESFESKIVITSVKGIIPVHLQLLSNYIHDRFSVHTTNSAVIAGPCHAEEVALEKQSYLTIASANPELALQIRELMQSRYISVKLSGDPEGVEWAAILKNVYAIACGVCHGLGFGDNFQAVLVANAMQEMQLFLDSHLPASRNTLESAYLGDLLVTAYSTFSRNRTFGNMIGRGYNVRAAEMELGMVAEGYHAVRALHQLREKLQIRLPIADAMHAVLYENAPVSSKIMELRGILS
jgi:glycerol-3-phosphate dehydrogenase (NAD(P)+)